MKNLFLSTCLLSVLLSSCQSHQSIKRNPAANLLKAPQYSIVDNGEEKKVKETKGDEEYIAPELQDDLVDEEVLKRMQEKLAELANLQMDDIEPAELAVPDYDVAQKALRAKISDETINYFNTLEEIKKDVNRTLSEVLALKRAADATGVPNNLLHKRYTEDIKKKIPALNERINKKYADAIKGLYHLGGSALLPVSKMRSSQAYRKGLAKSALKEKSWMNLSEGLLGICNTSICVAKMEIELEKWHSFVRSFNNQVNFVDFDGTKNTWTQTPVNPSPLATLALLDAANDMMKLGLRKNKDYSIAGVVAQHTGDVLVKPVGIGLALLSVPVYAFEKTSKTIAKILGFKVMKIKLALNSLDQYKEETVINGIRTNLERYANSMPNSAYYIHTGEDQSEILAPVFKNALSKAKDLVNHIGNYFTIGELLNLNDSNLMSLSEMIEYMSAERLKELYNDDDLTVEAKDKLEIAVIERDPSTLGEMSIDEQIDIITRSEKKKLLLDSLKKEDYEAIITRAPDLKISRSTTTPHLGNSTNYSSIHPNEDLSVAIVQPRFKKGNDNGYIGTTYKTNVLDSSLTGVCRLFGYPNHVNSLTENIVTNSYKTYIIDENGQYARTVDTTEYRQIVLLICKNDNVPKVVDSKNYKDLVKNDDGSYTVVEPRFRVANKNHYYGYSTSEDKYQSDLNAICSLYGLGAYRSNTKELINYISDSMDTIILDQNSRLKWHHRTSNIHQIRSVTCEAK